MYPNAYIWEQEVIVSALEDEESFYGASANGIELKEWIDC